jgi:hypothetical protein
MKKKIAYILSGAALLSISVTSLVACGDGTPDTPKVIDSIEIVSGSIKTTYTLDEVVDYSNLAINTLDKSDEIISTVTYANNESKFTLGDIDTTIVGTRDFTLVYTDEEYGDFSTSLQYSVTSNDSLTYSITSFEPNYKWTSYKGKIENVGKDPSKDPENTEFVESDDYVLGNYNGVDFMPIVTAYDLENDVYITLDHLPEGEVEISLKLDGSYVDVSDYLDDLDKLEEKGFVNFQDDKTGYFELTFTYQEGENENDFVVTYKFDVVAGYNVTSAKELNVITNTTEIESYKTENGLPIEIFDNVVIHDRSNQSDDDESDSKLTISVEDLPGSFFWTQEEVESGSYNGIDNNAVGSLKDFVDIYRHNLSEDHRTFNIYGNFNTLSFENIPFVKYSNGGMATESNIISTHSSLFGFNDNATNAQNDGSISIKDIHLFGNQGVSADENVLGSGLLGIKNHGGTVSFDNSIINKFFTAIINSYEKSDPTTDTTISDTKPVFYLNKSTVTDTFSAALFNYKTSVFNIDDSYVFNAGGPLIINQCFSFDVSNRNQNEEYYKNMGSFFKIDGDTYLKNLVSGQGGWFDIYNIGAQMNILKGLDDYFNEHNLAITDGDGSTEKLNFIAVNMGGGDPADSDNDSSSGITPDPGLVGGVSIDDRAYIDYDDGYDTYASGNLDSDFLTTTDFGAQYFQLNNLYSSNSGILPLLKTFDVDGDSTFSTLYANSNLGDTDAQITELKYLMQLLNGDYSGTRYDEANFASDYLGLYYSLTNSQASSPYEGSDNFGLVLGLNHTNG